MADIGQVLATGGTALVSAAAGAGLTYWFGALNRRHQQAREDETRWYDARFKAYAEFTDAAFDANLSAKLERLTSEDMARANERLRKATSLIRLVGSLEAVNATSRIQEVTMTAFREGASFDENQFKDALVMFEYHARTDLGHPLG
jgi:hypothetical protein